MGVDLCTVDDVINEGNISGTALNEKIVWKIINLSGDIKTDTKDDTLDRSNRDARRCCVFGVLAWLEKKKMIASSRQTLQEREGNTAVVYKDESDVSTTAKQNVSYLDEYKKYLARLRPMPPVGSKMRCH